jgi:hypothetical protein
MRGMDRNVVLLVGLVALVGCAQDAPPRQGWEGLDSESGGTGGGSVDPVEDDGVDDDTGGSGGTTDGDPTEGDPTVGDPTDGDPTDGDTDEPEPVDCTPGWATPWIGSPCAGDDDCSFTGGTCLLPEEGFPCGTCTLDCATVCPDEGDAPVTYCINGTDVGLDDAGYCLSRCDSTLFPDTACRDGYACEVLTRFDETGSQGVCVPDEFDAIDPPDDELIDEIDHEFLIQMLGGDPVNPFDYGPDLDSFQLYLDAVGVQHFTAEEIVTPHNQAAATECGYTILLPERDQWEKAAALAMFTDELRELVGEPIYMRNWWRPPCYNAAVGGAAGGDHPDADAVDLDFSSATSRAIAQKFLCESYWSAPIVTPDQIAPGADVDPMLNMSVGLGGLTIHLGVLSNGGRRNWFYGSYTNEPDSGNCW